MAVSIADMEKLVMGGDDDIGNVIELGDMGDDLGLNLLANPSKVTVNQASHDTGRSVSFSPPAPASFNFGSGNDDLGGIEVTPLEPLEPIKMNDDFSSNAFSSSQPSISFQKESSSSYGGGGLFGNSQSATGPGVHLSSPARDPEAEKKEKSDYLNKLQRLEQKGFPVSRKFTMDNSLDEVKTEYFRLVDARNLETSIKFQRQMLMSAVTGMEWLNEKFDPFDVRLEGWSESVHENVEDFDEIFEELYDKYKDRGKMAPEMRLVMAVAGSGFMCHVSNTFFRSKMPSMDDVLRRNPELMKQMAAAAANQAGQGFGNFMGMAMGVPQGPSQAPPNVSGIPSMAPMSSAGAFMGASSAPPVSPPPAPFAQGASNIPTARREMKGPSGVDDILKTFEEVRRAEMTQASIPQPAAGFSSQPAVAAAMSGAVSVISADEMMSTGTAATGQQRRRRKQTAPPVGNTFTLNV
jgi:hypothetical protein